MLILLEGINYYINSPFRTIILLALIALICFILLLLYYRFNHFGRRIRFPMNCLGTEDKLGPKEWEQEMLTLAAEHKQVRLIRYSFVLDDYNQVAYKKLNRIRDTISEISADIISLIPAARWLFDNFQMMYREIKKVRTSGTSYAILPILKSRQYGGFPRIYVVAKKMVALSGGHLNEENISVMLKAYQTQIPLTDKELWALPEMLGFCLLESIIDSAEEILRMIDVKSKADSFVRERLDNKPMDISVLLTELSPELKKNYSFHSHVIYQLKNMSFHDLAIQRYIEYHFNSKGKLKPSNIFLEEGKAESFLETNIRALIVSLRDINEVDEERFFEEYSYLEQILSKDPDGIYSMMDAEAKGMYRGVIVKLSLRYRINEEKIVNDCLLLAMEGRDGIHCPHHVGSYLLGTGYPILKAKILDRTVPQKLKKSRNIKGSLYFAVLFLIVGLIALFILWISYRWGRQGDGWYHAILLLAGLPLFAGISLELTNFIFTRRIMVKKIPSLNYISEIPEEARTFVVMPVIVSSREQGLEYMDRLEKHYLANRQNNLHFALLADHEDSPEQFLPKDEVIENALIARMKELNELYPDPHQRFCLFFRYRKWNKSENCYMGWERKRGKLEEFNNLLNGIPKEETSFSGLFCEEELLPTFRYVITLDADTNLLRDNAAKLVGVIHHPLNRPVLDPDNQKVKEGYVIIQPSVRNHIVDKSGSRFAEIFGGESGLAHYGAVISDIYQDIFNEGIYIGKGIYDVQAFHKLLHNRIPENSVLSHDLLESCYARTAFSSTAKIMDSFPASVLSFAKREHRWIRGDWQLLPWLFSRKKVNGKVLCALAKWKIFDNLRRSFVPLSKTLFLLFNMAFFPKIFWLWIPLLFFGDVFQIIVLLIAVLMQKFFRPKLALVYKGFLRELGTMCERAVIEFAITPYRAYIATDAMLRTIFRLFITKKNLLRWNTAESVDFSIINTKKGYFLTMWSTLLAAFLLLMIMLLQDIPAVGLVFAVLVTVLWFLAFHIAYAVSQPKEKKLKKDQPEDIMLLLETARRTWQFFKEFSTKENNWLCPDNYQVSQAVKVSDKTSPTNIGLQFMAILSARDFGFETLSSTVTNLENLMDTVQRLLKWKGHLYNWYQVNTLEVLNPAYISTVDSGNFLGHIIAVKNGLLEQFDKPILSDSYMEEIRSSVNQSNYELSHSDCVRHFAPSKLDNRYNTVQAFLEDVTDIWEELNGREIKPCNHTRWTRVLMKMVEDMVNETAALQLKDSSLPSRITLRQLIDRENKQAVLLGNRIRTLCNKIDNLVAGVDFRFLYNDGRMLFHIGYHVSNHVLDGGCYDLMASECALTSLLAIAKGEVPMKHWFKLGRPLTIVKGIPCFVSWSGTMFEYLMPNLVFKEYEGSVYSETAKAAVLQHMKYAQEAGIPWGISESQYYRFDLNSNYQYKAFGVPKIRLQPVRKNSLVVAPYATLLALDIASQECIENLKDLQGLGAFGEFGFYESIDFNVPSSIDMTPYCIVRSYMAHHQGMNLVAINNYLHHGIMKARFHSEAMIKSAEVLLEEKRDSHLISLAKRGYTIKIGKPLFREVVFSNRYINSVTPEIPVVNYMASNKYSLMITSDGDGFSRYEDMMLYRWRGDVYANTGSYIYIKDVKQSKYWSTTYHPTKAVPDDYQAVFTPHQAEFKRRDGDITTHMIVSLDSDHNFEIRKVKLSNHSNEAKHLEVTSYMEVVGDTHMAELSHPAFNKLFLESEYIEEQALFLSRRRGKKDGNSPYLMHMVRGGSKFAGKVECENDRKRFIGRNNNLENPEAVACSLSYTNSAGFNNDPIMSLRVDLYMEAGESACISFITGICESREEAVKLADELNVNYRIDDMLEKFRLQKDLELKYLEITRAQLNAFQDLISPIFYPSGSYRGPEENIRRNFKNQSALWRFGVSGDNPIMLLRVTDLEAEGIIRDVLKAYEYMRINRIQVDLIILIDAKHGYLQEVDDLINDMTSSLRIHDSGSERPSFFMLHTFQMIPAEIDLLYTVARIVFSEETGIYFRNVKENLEEPEDE